ncbi:Post-GPI attachment to proteins factor 3 [Dermatophagoides pteronyssinus]|uniref:Post-GPI attachment to proteins factor 3 n=1 Tax=Dermatophagoides pteronyssinus TaxID=6956 RepID=A0ABQ8IZ89_DERPT|nr:Post-GPI attachment to proteins factor 3 [Dermatophagoides pteronyssinus]
MNIAQASFGDRLRLFQYFFIDCVRNNCSEPNLLTQFESRQPVYLKLFGWDCQSECQLQAQWQTIDRLQNDENVHSVPQFYGKWTFYRLYGIQEPASFIFSIGNLATNLYCWKDYRIFGEYSNDPFYNLWRIQAFISMNAWFWSMVFHARETPLTEKLDYFSAYLIVIYLLYTITIKMITEMFDLKVKKIQISLAIPFIGFYIFHLIRMYQRFDYGYNMKINIMTGITSTILWLVWCFINRFHRKHIRKCFLSLAFVNICLVLELFDFAPIFYTFDAHSIWHFATAFFPFFWYSFLKDEAIFYLVQTSDKDAKEKLL